MKICFAFLLVKDMTEFETGCQHPLDFVVNRFLMKSFKTNNVAIVLDCTVYLNFKLPSVLLVSRYSKFLIKYEDNEK